MTSTTPPLPTGWLACQQDPERWFDRSHHTDALAACLDCRARRWCAGEALRSRASFGLWAGIWIDERHEDAAPHLHAIADDGRPQRSPTEPAAAPMGRSRAPTPLRRPASIAAQRSAAAAVLARSTGHCEVLAEGCGYTYEHLLNRHPKKGDPETFTAPGLFAACSSCADMIAASDPKLCAWLGYLIESHRDPAQVPFYWRGSRWVLFDPDGWLTETRDFADTA
jgi:hypothetical protein